MYVSVDNMYVSVDNRYFLSSTTTRLFDIHTAVEFSQNLV